MSEEENVDTPEDAPETPEATEAPAEPADTSDLSDEVKTMAMLCHILGIIFIGAIIIWLIKKDDHPFIDQEGKESVNFQITAFIGYVIVGVVGTVLAMVIGPLGSLLTLLLWVGIIILCIQGGLKAKEGEAYRYPFNFRFIK